MIPKTKYSFLLALVFCVNSIFAQKVGIVLSGGGSGGLCHIGVLKALEENNIPIDYITGTSIGSLIGAYYAAGYSPTEMEQLVKTGFFQQITRGDMPAKYTYFLKKRDDYASWQSFKVAFNTNILNNLPTNVINSVPIDYYLMETFAGVNAYAKNNFDSLMIPYRCLASDIENKEIVTFRKGDLSSSIRASMSYPFYLRPIPIDGKLLFDGGLYNNLPTDVMYDEFYPDFIIGSSVAERTKPPSDDNLYLQLRHLLMTQTNFNPVCENGVLIEPWCDVNIFNFEEAKRLIDSGYVATMRNMPKIKLCVERMADNEVLKNKRAIFRSKANKDSIIFDKVEIHGVGKRSESFIRNSIFHKGKPFSLSRLKKQYFRLTSDDKIKSVYPIAVKDTMGSGFYKLKLMAKKEKSFFIDLGGNISNRPISEAFLGLQYNHLGRIGFSAYVNGYYGKLHGSTHAKLRFDFPARLPFYIEPTFTYSRWDYFRSSALFYDFEKPAYLLQEDIFGELNVGLPLGNVSKVVLSGGYSEWGNRYYQTENFTKLDTADATYFDFGYGQISYELNTHNRKQYATNGTKIHFRAKFIDGAESFYPGTTSLDSVGTKNYPYHNWFQFKFTLDSYIRTFKGFKIGVFAEGVYSTQPFFKNYTSSILSAPAFNPTLESQTLFIPQYRAHQYVAGGIKAITTPYKNFDIRFEGYLFQPITSIVSTNNQKAKYTEPFLYRNFIGLVALVYNTPVGPVSIGVNYYDKNPNSFSFFFHFGYIIFNKKSID
ncbi:MAG: patatin-like phospholipase family protein [Sphingobacteriaceae bacterium]|nr:patatin-like phospholipase family protein [Sphingobacteriaceae bacterium]